MYSGVSLIHCSILRYGGLTNRTVMGEISVLRNENVIQTKAYNWSSPSYTCLSKVEIISQPAALQHLSCLSHSSGPDGRLLGSRRKTQAERKYCKSKDNKKQYARRKENLQALRRENLAAKEEIRRLLLECRQNHSSEIKTESRPSPNH